MEEKELNIHMPREVRQVLWDSVFGDLTKYENHTFRMMPYSWADDAYNDYHFVHKPSGFMIQWYKYPLRGALCNMDITHEQFYDILKDCHNSMQYDRSDKVKVLMDCNQWWRYL